MDRAARTNDQPTASAEPAEPARSRRGLIAGAVGIAAALVLSDADRVSAGVDGDVILGAANTTTNNTAITNTSGSGATALTLRCDNSLYGFGLQATGSAYGISGTGNTYAGVAGDTSTAGVPGVSGQSRSATGQGSGVFGFSQSPNGRGVTGQSPGIGVYGLARSISSEPPPPAGTIGVLGSAPETGGIGGVFRGSNAPLLLLPAATAGAPTTGTHQVGELSVSSDGNLYFCRVAGAPGTWVQLGAPAPAPTPAPTPAPRLVLLSTPERFVDTRANLGGVRGPLPAQGTTLFTMTGRNGESGNAALQIPDNATALVGNLTVLGSTPSLGYLTMWPGGFQPTVSNVNFGPSAATGAVANSFLVGLSPVGGHGTLKVFNSVPCDYLIDVTAYYV